MTEMNDDPTVHQQATDYRHCTLCSRDGHFPRDCGKTTPAPDPGTPELNPYDRLGTHMMRHAVHDAERIKAELDAAVGGFPGLTEAFRLNDARLFSDRIVEIEVRVRIALAKAGWVLDALKGE